MGSTNQNNVDNREEDAEKQQQHKQPPVMPQNVILQGFDRSKTSYNTNRSPVILARGRKRKCQQTYDGHAADKEEDELLQLQKPNDGNKGIEDGYADNIKFGTKSSSSNSAHSASMLAIGVSADKYENVIELEECKTMLAQRDSLIQQLSRQNAQMQEEKEENSKFIAEKSQQIDALHIQLNEMRQPQNLLPPRQMKVQLPFENWAELLGFLSRRELGEVVAKVGNRHFAWLLQSFLHEYGEITLGSMEVLPPDEEFASGRPFIRAKPIYMKRWKKMLFTLEHEAMPENITNFHEIKLSYFNDSVLNFLQQFKQKSLLSNVNLSISTYMPVDIVQILLIHLLPSIESINSITLLNITGFNAGLCPPLDADRIELCCRWLSTPREDDGKSRVLFLSTFSKITHISRLIERIKKDFLAATQQVMFLILLHGEIQEELNFENAQSNERLEIKTLESHKKGWEKNTLLIARHPMGLQQKQWLEANVKEALAWTFNDQSRKITMKNVATKIVM